MDLRSLCPGKSYHIQFGGFNTDNVIFSSGPDKKCNNNCYIFMPYENNEGVLIHQHSKKKYRRLWVFEENGILKIKFQQIVDFNNNTIMSDTYEITNINKK